LKNRESVRSLNHHEIKHRVGERRSRAGKMLALTPLLLTMTTLSPKNIPARERLIFALDVPTVSEAEAFADRLGDSVQFYKLGLQIFMAGDYFALIQRLQARGKKVFADLKFFDVPETVGAAVAQLQNRGIEFATVHGNDEILKAAVKKKSDVKILAVTVLTSLDQGDLRALGFSCDVEALVLSRARRALKIGCDGVISSGIEAPKLRENLGENFLIVSPGIRPVDNNVVDDQKRTVDIEQAFLNGADYIVVGRPIRKAADPKQKAEEIQARIAALFSKAG
jgi:orotidine-5'-phosphate decarboxylase